MDDVHGRFPRRSTDDATQADSSPIPRGTLVQLGLFPTSHLIKNGDHIARF